jgi:signal transduction histidine kinase
MQNRQTSKELARARTRLDFLQNTISKQVIESKENFQAYVREKVAPELELLSSEVEKLTSETSDVSRLAATQQIRTVALDIIRPLSHELYSADVQMQSERSQDASQAVSRVTVRQLISRRMSMSAVFSPALPAILILAFYSVSYYIVAGWVGVIEGCFATTAVVSLLLTLLNRLTVGRELNSLLVLLIGITTAVALSYLYVLIPNALNLEIPADFLAFLALGAGLVLVGTTIVFFLYDTWIFALSRTKETNEENASIVARSRQEVWLRQKQIAKIVHGSIQSRLNAARIKLTQAETITPQLIEAVLSDLESAKQELSLPVTELATDIESQLSDLTDFWQGVCAITHNLDQQSKLSLLADSSAAQAVMEVVSEGVSNAVKHSQAKEVHLTITQAIPVSVNVDLQHASMNSSAQSTNSGLGTQIMNQLTLNWSFNIDGGKAQLLAQIPVAR